LGLLLRPLTDKLNLGAGGDAHGIDREMINVDRGYSIDQCGDAPIRRIKADVLSLPPELKRGSFAVIYAHHLVEHLHYHHVGDAIKAWADLLEPGGVMYLCVPDTLWAMVTAIGRKDLLSERRRMPNAVKYIDWKRANGIAYNGTDHLSIWTEESLAKVVAESGLEARIWERQLSPSANWLAWCEATVIGIKPAGAKNV
ncbi:MAG: methyltransferase domain-containing protein, partial [Aliifodinibius sp.]|nr:class I SAM-dependent methyltransferase [Fodinibius sp.]NIX55401.1 methyltransferase domain-containing protein [candidate division Zixibacteria bacterium]NIY24670.1 methyltransferase domain-containing protein [Fodinibius sp.]